MPGPFAPLPPLLAQAAAKAPAAAPAQEPTGGLISLMLPLLAMIVLYQLLIGGPQRKQEQRRREMIRNLKRNDKVLTTGGLYGTVVSSDPDHDRIVLRVDDDKGVKMEFARAAIAQVLNADKDVEKDKPAAASK